MPQVPFSGVQQVAPGGVPLSRYHADVSPETFGGGVAQALSSLGGTLQKSGNELFERGIAMQTLYNHSEAQEADAKYTEEAGKLHAEYNSLEGKNAVDAYPAYIENLKKTRQSIRDGLSNETSQKLFESASNGTMGRSIFNGAGHAAGQNKKYALGASVARISAIGDQTLSMPEDDRAFTAGLATTEAEVRSQAQLQGLSPEATEEAVSTQKSKLWGERVKGLAKQQPILAGKMLDDGIKRGDIRGEDIGKLTSIVQQQRNTVGARMISNQVLRGEGTRMGQGVVPIEQAQEAIGTFESGGRYNLVGREVTDKSGNTGSALGKYQVMSYNLKPWLAEAGMPAMTEKEFLASPAAQDQLFNAKFGGYMKKYGSFNDAATAWFAGEGSVGKAGTDRRDVHGTNVPAYLANTNAILARNAPLATKVEEAKRMAAEQVPDDPLFPDYVEQRVTTDHARGVAIRRDTEFQNRQVVEDGLMGGQSGHLPTTIEELTNTPEKAQAWQDLLPQNQRRYMAVLARNAKGDTNWNDERLREYQRLKGLADSNPADFLDTDIVGTDLPLSARKELMNLQVQRKGKAEADPRTTRAMNIISREFPTGIPVRKDDKDSYDRFVGNVIDQLRDLTEEKKRPPTYDEVKTIGSRLIQQQHSERFWFRSSTDNMYRIPVPPKVIEDSKALDPNLTDAEIQRRYTRLLYKQLYGGTTSAATPNAPSSR